jgi:hypothetical protein
MTAVSRLAGHALRARVVEARRDLRRWQETRARFWHVVVVSTFFLTVIGAGIYLGTVMVISALRTNTGLTELTADSRTGRIARSLQDGKLCRYILFDNKTGQAVEDRIARCDEATPKLKRQTPATFSWGR